MTDADRLLQTYIERYEAGDSPDPSELLDQAERADRARLAALIEGYLEHAAPSQRWDPGAFEASVASRAAEMLKDEWEAEASALPAQLVALRKHKELKRATLVDRLAEELGFAAQRDRVAAHYNAMEHGRLDPAGISTKVYDALAAVLGTTVAALRKAGKSVAPSADDQASPAFARTTRSEEATDEAVPSDRATQLEPEPNPSDWDEIDRLFRGGDNA